LVAPVREAARQLGVIAIAGVDASIPLIYSPGFVLALTCLVSVVALRLSAADVRAVVPSTARRCWAATSALIGFLVFAELTHRAGMTSSVARSVADAMGPAYLAAAPLVGGMGGFVTGSNAAGNAMLMAFQLEMAMRLGFNEALMAAVQNTSGAAFGLAAPSRVVLAGAVIGAALNETALVRTGLMIVLGAAAIVGCQAMAWHLLTRSWGLLPFMA
jgi:lactate permease